MSAQPEQAAKEILRGEPAAAARRWLGPTALVMFVLFAIDTVLVINGFWLPIDIRVAIFVTWMSFMLAASLAPRIKPIYRPAVWILAITVIVLTCIARVWAGDHWPSDVVGGVLLGTGWSAFVLWLPERWLPSPSLRWFGGRLRRRSPSQS